MNRTATLWLGFALLGAAMYAARRAAGFTSPVPGARITSPYGLRQHPVTGELKRHEGVDYGAATGTPVLAAQSGRVATLVRGHAVAGNYIVVAHSAGRRTRYLHLSKFEPGIEVGSKVKRGQKIGEVGATGRVTGPHLHFELEVAGRRVDPALAV